jgi:hypothetical protein
VKYKNNGDKSKFIFEIALGENTTKVSSCFPCSTFMAANDIPASSTHLGRGDNWNIPTDAYEMRKNWEKQINLWYSTAKGLLQAKSNAKTNNLLAMMANNHREQNVPAIFLEALTFERPFTERIKNTLEIKPK